MIKKIMACIFFAVFVIYYILSEGLSSGTFRSPKAGFLPQVIGILGILLTLVNLFFTFRNDFKKFRQKPEEATQKTEDEIKESKAERKTWLNIAIFSVLSFAFVISLKYIGYLAASILYMMALMKLANTKGWIKPAIISVCVAGAFYFSFSYLLGVNLP